ncbi:GDSL-type esterase/lipase family protein [Priestia taiwanensis]|uniref:Lipase/acylhydrolase n=1 Tax=Priestia taiwanensis TaxID=1347902 RepID=A0A917AHU6_9BACI|nr:GDSL-type esterase/lipase family protein [Priestia taiwanensis]MBM7361446.1 lysophospholipase L1-like esterase [Priestia taiwanensis]GGE54207.1 lipase/acylhydrolase [Priestia taiwanensis]
MKKFFTILLLFVALLGGAGYYAYKHFFPSVEKLEKEIIPEELATPWLETLPNAPLNHLVLGDSVAYGTGSQQKGFVSMATNTLNKEHQKQFKLENLAMNGMTSNQLLKSVQKPKTRQKIQKASLITISIGGNDILKLDRSLGIMEGMNVLKQTRENYVSNLEQILEIIRQENEDAVIVLSELYNPIQLDNNLASIADSFIGDWNDELFNLSVKYGPATVMETSKLLTADTRKSWAFDEVHPNDKGYKLLADEMVSGLVALQVEKK